MSLQLVYRKRTAAAWIPALCLSLVVGGCAWHKVTLNLTPTVGGSVAATQQGSIPLIIDEIRVFQNDAAVNPSLEFTQRLASAIRSAQIFASVYEPTNAHSAPARSAHMRLEVHESAQPDQGAFLKGVLIGVTLFALTPALPLHVEGQYSMQASVDLPNGTTRHYDARSEGYVSFTLFYPAVMAGRELDGKATEENLQAIVARMRSDPLLVEALR